MTSVKPALLDITMKGGVMNPKCGGSHYNQRKTFKQKIHERDNHTCQVCGAPSQEVDHIIPWAISHDSTPSNMRAICIKCNRELRRQRKDAALPWDEWLARAVEILS